MSVRERTNYSVFDTEVEIEGQTMINNKYSKDSSSSTHSSTKNVSEKVTVFKCSLCKKDRVKVGGKITGHKCRALIRLNGLEESSSSPRKLNSKGRNRSASVRKRFRCSLCKKDLEKVGHKFMIHKCSKLLDYIPAKEKIVDEVRTLLRCPFCNELVEKVGQEYKNHRCSKLVDLYSSIKLDRSVGEQVDGPQFVQPNPICVNESQSNDKCLLCDGDTLDISCDHLPKEKGQTAENSFKYTNQSIRHSNNCINVDSWVKEHMDKGVVRFYKPKGSILHSHPDLAENDLIIMILNEAQCEILKQYGSDCVCVDATEGLRDDFELVTLMVVDDQGHGLPCCFMLTNRVDTRAMEILFNVIKTVVGCSIGASILMTDVSPVFWTAWNVVMRCVPLNWLYSSWQVTAAWKKNLSLVRRDDKRTAVQNTLTAVLQERDETTFTQLLGSALEEWGLDQDTVEFSSYFIAEFSHNVTNWAYCYRKHLGEDKNANLERLQTVLKPIHHLGNQTQSLDKFIPSLMGFINDKNHCKKTTQLDDMTTKIADIALHHQAALCMKKVQVSKTSEGWSLYSGNSGMGHNVVASNLICDCKLKCDLCKICIHSYKCSCHQSSFTVCPHIHYLAINCFKSVLNQSEELEQSVKPTAGQETVSVVFDPGVECFVSDLLGQSFDSSINSLSTLETDTSTDNNLVLQSPSRESDNTHIPDNQQQVVDELEYKKKRMILEFQQILDRVSTLKDAQILETFLKPILPALISSQLSTSVAAQTPGTTTLMDTTTPQTECEQNEKEECHS